MKKYIAELFGTLVLSLAVIGSIINLPNFPTSIIAGVTLTLLVFTIGAISGTHINPAVTLGIYLMKKISTKDALFYIIFQFIGVIGAILIINSLGQQVPMLIPSFTIKTLVGEFIGTTLFVFGIASVVNNSKENIFAPFIIGGSLTIGAILASIASNGVLNPAISLAVSSFNLAYILGPLLGACAGVLLYKKIYA